MMLELSSNQVKFLMDLMMGCPLGFTKDHAVDNGICDSRLYNYLDQRYREELDES